MYAPVTAVIWKLAELLCVVTELFDSKGSKTTGSFPCAFCSTSKPNQPRGKLSKTAKYKLILVVTLTLWVILTKLKGHGLCCDTYSRCIHSLLRGQLRS